MKKLLLILYFLVLILFSFFSFLFVDPNLIYLKWVYADFSTSNRFISTLFYIVFVVILFTFYFLFLNFIKKKKINLKYLKWTLGGTISVLLVSYPAMLSFDIFNYIATSKVLYLYKENPYLIMPIAFSGDPLLLFMHAANKTALYGPVWIILTGIPYFVGFDNFILTLFSFKLFIVLFYILTVILLWKISKNILSVFMFALNPLVIIETLISGHNDIVMLFLALFSFLLLKKKKFFFAILIFAASILIKYSSAFLIPVFLFYFYKIVKNQKISEEKIFYYCTLSMMLIFFLSFLREEIYPWYAIWFLGFSFINTTNKLITYFSLALSFSLLLRYIPFMFLGTYFGPTPIIKILLTFIPPVSILAYFFFKDIWLKKSFR